ncbi:hypothetical protein ORIO_18455 [Cereibacter azotoformans]|uniref:hypothetical protein n=1 Tax=Cereibacter azotoformans TaxID=43057 RepID=UPI001EEA0DC8|nr:hypothetical protein [Cereibacter azotoformans]ULB11821.1 hypothetical protein ORIO_18455 [Cereibacter azotoformans]
MTISKDDDKSLEAFTRKIILQNFAPQIGNLRSFIENDLQKTLEGFRLILSEFLSIGRDLAKVHGKVKTLEAAGFLPHKTMPWQSFDEPHDKDDIAKIVKDYYNANWGRIQSEMEASIQLLNIDSDARLAFCEALRAHGLGMYRSVVRNLMCEVERLVRVELANSDFGSRQSQEFLSLIGHLPVGYTLDFDFGTWIYLRISEHIYKSIKDPQERERFVQDPIPNRHAAIHGIICYDRFEHSLNTIILAHFLFHEVHLVKNRLSKPTA